MHMAERRLEEMSLEELWELFPIVLTPHDERWAEWADKEMARLRPRLGPSCTALHHIGSTAVPDLWAKPIVDLLAEADGPASLPDLKIRLLCAGYRCMSESAGRISFNRGYTPSGFAERVFHLHLRVVGDADELRFRDYLRSHADVAREYEALKRSLWKRYEHDRDGYTAAKADFVRHYTAVAKAEG